MLNSQFILGINEEITVDLFAGGGGMSTAIEQAIGRYVDVAVNHNAEAISMHEANHPQTRHYIGDVFEVDPREASDGRAVGLLHLSPDCTHHSQASGGQPRDRKTRALSWVGKRWAGQVRPRVMTLENVKQILHWGPLIAKRDKATGRVLKLDGTVAEPGERVPLQAQYLVPDPKKIGKTWRAFVAQLRAMGYAVEWKILCAADFGAPTTRERLFMVARCDGQPIHWPEPTHTKVKTKGKKRWRSAAECIDWSVPCPSIFDREKPLADATLRRIARGLKKYVLESANPFIVPIAHYNGRDACQPAQEPLRTITAYPKGGAFAVASPVLVQTGYGERAGQAPRSLDLDAPLGTVVAGGTKHALTTAYLAQMNGGFNTTPGHDLRRPASTITHTGSQQQVVMAHLTHLRGHCDARDMEDPLMTISAGGQHQALVECTLSPDDEARTLRVAAFLIRYYGEGGQLGDLHDPMATITTKDRLALVTVHVEGTPYVIVDIGLRMLQPRELYRAQGFPDTYIIDHGHDGRKFSKSAQVRMCGNSVSPPPAIALISANYTDASGKRMVA
ncbi:DNA cytosine methyltransferase [Acidithiobacillus thiooxidans]|uniref:DNA cytosine methyltransferase n=1 Tax=Acidithiobacillus TaxID=119977 RepID=UPI0002624B1E|nr:MULTISPECIES: DNA cytosine methyltransferase [Acidithiobacillus]MBU2740248.1 DNA cytosine methyltransferase [Acidithiobacillus albertensis]MBU2812003.1 DNA cytosine methyltransferase [Acidithiobacillus thiooxidans]MBU2834288.1 DNA cytosine methyltransferase [Acidithiobacillus thiooxidans]